VAYRRLGVQVCPIRLQQEKTRLAPGFFVLRVPGMDQLQVTPTALNAATTSLRE
jgi:hypothetical protein